jgi:hypothetical protein
MQPVDEEDRKVWIFRVDTQFDLDMWLAAFQSAGRDDLD